MAVEVEKKYRVTTEQRERLAQKLQSVNAICEGTEFETNTLFAGGALSLKQSVLRLRTVKNKAVLTYKEELPSDAGVKRRLEHETVLSDGVAMFEILTGLEYKPRLIYEKRRETWRFENVEIVLDELPFGFYVEIEGAESGILKAEKLLKITDLIVEPKSYPTLTVEFGARRDDVIEARFAK